MNLEKGTICSSWNYNGTRLASASIHGYVSVTCSSSNFKVSEFSIEKVVWVPPEYGDALACVSSDGTLSLWEEEEEEELLHPEAQTPEAESESEWKLCKTFDHHSSSILDIQFGASQSSLKMVVAYSDGYIKVYELLDPLELKNWQLQAEFQNVSDSVSTLGKASCLSASISWKPQRGESNESSFVIAFNSDTPQLNSPKVWEFDEAHQRWLPVAELALPDNKGDGVFSVAWAPNIGRPYEIIAIASNKGIAIWHIGLNPDTDGRLSLKQVSLLNGHTDEVWEMEWDMSGMTLASTGSDGRVRLWQANLNGVWQQQAAFNLTS